MSAERDRAVTAADAAAWPVGTAVTPRYGPRSLLRGIVVHVERAAGDPPTPWYTVEWANGQTSKYSGPELAPATADANGSHVIPVKLF